MYRILFWVQKIERKLEKIISYVITLCTVPYGTVPYRAKLVKLRSNYFFHKVCLYGTGCKLKYFILLFFKPYEAQNASRM